MINVRVQLRSEKRIFWTSPIHNPRALALLLTAMRRRGIATDVYDDASHAYVADGCFAIAAAECRIEEMSWGPGNRPIYRCDVAEMPTAVGSLGPDPAPAHAANADEPTPRDLAGPLPAEVAAHSPWPASHVQTAAPPLITAFDVHGCPDRPRSSTPPQPALIQPLLSPPTWLDRLLAWLTGTPRGKAVQP